MSARISHELADLSPCGLVLEAVYAGFHFHRDRQRVGQFTPVGRTAGEQAKLDAIARELDRRRDEIQPTLLKIMEVSGGDDLPRIN